MHTVKNHLILLFLAITTSVFAQDNNSTNSSNNSVVTDGDPRIEKLIKSYDKIKQKNNKVAVYRVQVFSGSRENANAALKHFQNNHYSHYSNIIYDQPNFKVKVGAFRTRSEASLFIKSIKKKYNSSFVLKENIEYDEFIKERSEKATDIESDENGENSENFDY